ncbi:MAG TPA: hypothetical protein VG097_04000 [Gemmata sp.]|jgi:hypothetical protein|nr:hypothetical protein [Gemmata sp.]
MTEVEWLACADPGRMLQFIRDKASDRKLRLFIISCCRYFIGRLHNQATQRALAIAEQFAEGKATGEELQAAYNAAGNYYSHTGVYGTDASDLPARAAMLAAEGSRFGIIELYSPSFRFFTQREHARNSLILRDIFPFRPITLNPSWLTSTVLALASQMYDSGDFSALPILADALQDAGCDNSDILDHCRGPGPHVRGCWVVDKLLAKK